MYRFLDLHNCPDDISIDPSCPSAVLDEEHLAFCVITPDGRLMYCNRSFLMAHSFDHVHGFNTSIREFLPQLWEQFIDPGLRCPEGLKVVNLRLHRTEKPVGHLLVNFRKTHKNASSTDLSSVLLVDEHPEFINAYDGLYVATPEADTVKVNPSYERIAFLSEQDLVGRNLAELVEKGFFSRSVTLSIIDDLKQRQTREKTTFLQTLQCGKNVLVTGMPVFSPQTELTHILTHVQDLLPLDTILEKCIRRGGGQSGISAEKTSGAEAGKSVESAGKHHYDEDLPMFPDLPVVAKDPLSIAALRQVVMASSFDAPVLLTGETGAGKDLMAKYLYRLMAADAAIPFVPVNCSAIPADLLESELFGYEEGAFSGASRGGKEGLFASASGGILFLNEISEMGLDLQAKLLTVLDEGCFRPLGSSIDRQVQVRIVCATNRDLRSCIEQGTFRRDLYYRIKVLTIHLSPLRQRKLDIVPLLFHFMTRISVNFDRPRFLSPAVQELLHHYHWPGNVRELKNVVEQLAIISPTTQISIGDLPEDLFTTFSGDAARPAEMQPVPGATLKESVLRYEKTLILEALAHYNSTANAARALGIDPTTLSRKLKRIH